MPIATTMTAHPSSQKSNSPSPIPINPKYNTVTTVQQPIARTPATTVKLGLDFDSTDDESSEVSEDYDETDSGDEMEQEIKRMVDPAPHHKRALLASKSHDTINRSGTPGLKPAFPYNVSMPSTVHKDLPLPDDSQISNRLPRICVDYLSHEFVEDDVWTSWKVMTRSKNSIYNGIRLENASWRTWAKQRSNLGTIPPESLNWLKDSDENWLYGPLHTATEPEPVATPQPGPTKPILKYRSLSDVLSLPNSKTGSRAGSEYGGDDDGPIGHIGSFSHLEAVSSQHSLASYLSSRSAGSRKGWQSSPSDGQVSPPLTSGRSPDDHSTGMLTRVVSYESHAGTTASRGKHITFNNRVDQCIARDETEDDLVVSTSKPKIVRKRSSHLQPNSSSDTPVTIVPLPPTILKCSEALPAPSPLIFYPPDDAFDTGTNGLPRRYSNPILRTPSNSSLTRQASSRSAYDLSSMGKERFVSSSPEGYRQESPDVPQRSSRRGSSRSTTTPGRSILKNRHASSNGGASTESSTSMDMSESNSNSSSSGSPPTSTIHLPIYPTATSLSPQLAPPAHKSAGRASSSSVTGSDGQERGRSTLRSSSSIDRLRSPSMGSYSPPNRYTVGGLALSPPVGSNQLSREARERDAGRSRYEAALVKRSTISPSTSPVSIAIPQRPSNPFSNQDPTDPSHSQSSKSPQSLASPTTPIASSSNTRHNPILGHSPPSSPTQLLPQPQPKETPSFRSTSTSTSFKHRRDSSTSDRSPVPPAPTVADAKGENYSGTRRSLDRLRQGEASPAQKALMRHGGRSSFSERRTSSSGEENNIGTNLKPVQEVKYYETPTFEADDDSGVIGRGKNSVEIAGTARDLIGAIWNVGTGGWRPRSTSQTTNITTTNNNPSTSTTSSN